MRTQQGGAWLLVAAAVAAATVLSLLVPRTDAFLLPVPAPTTQQPRAAHPVFSLQRPSSVLLRAAGDDDYPSDTSGTEEEEDAGSPSADVNAAATAATPRSAGAGSGAESFSAEGGRAQVRDSLKCQLYKIGAKTNRGQLANLDQQNEAINLVAQLEAQGSGRPLDPVEVEGRWDLIYSDAAPFRVSPFFMALGKVMDSASLSSEDFFRLHRLATSGSEIGRVRQIITSSELVSEVDIITGIPSIPFQIKGTVVSRADAQRTGESSSSGLKLSFKSTTVQSASIFPFDFPELPIAELAGRFGLTPPPVVMTTTYADANMRISRAEGGDHFFVFARGSSL